MSSDILSAKFASKTLLATDRDQDIAVTITMPKGRAQVRPPLSLAIVIDRSGSMEGEALANAKAAAAKLVDALSPGDAFTVIAYSTSVETVFQMSLANDANKLAAARAIDSITSDGNTCISCGIEQGAAQLARSPLGGDRPYSGQGIARMVLISDGQANSGLYDRDELAQLATETAAKGVSISTVGVGLDFDEVTMTRLADVGHGHYYFVEDTANLAQMFRTELDSMTETVAADVRLVVRGTGMTLGEAYGYPIVARGREDIVIPVADLRAGETRKVVIRSHVALNNIRLGSSYEMAQFRLQWRGVADGSVHEAQTNLVASFSDDASQVAATIDRGAVNAIETARTARVLEDAARTYETQGAAAAQQVLEQHRREVQDNKYMDAPALEAIDRATSSASGNFSKAPPAKAMKATRMDAYDLAR
ncbi:MAG TPA: VWA domain-containing protein [Kofleriaceae bacterium]|nr:VWA domain-containing protein [Kofleriaceae bacterium]